MLILQEEPGEALARYTTQTLLNFNLVWTAVHDHFITGIFNFSAPNQNPANMLNITAPP